MKTFLLLFFPIILSCESKSQTSIDIGWIDSIVKSIDTLLPEDHQTQVILNFHNDDLYVLSVHEKKLLKVVRHEYITTTVPLAKNRKDSITHFNFSTDTLYRNYYFFNDTLIKVHQSQNENDISMEFYFQGDKSLNKCITNHGRAFIITKSEAVEKFLKESSSFISYYKSFLK